MTRLGFVLETCEEDVRGELAPRHDTQHLLSFSRRRNRCYFNSNCVAFQHGNLEKTGTRWLPGMTAHSAALTGDLLPPAGCLLLLLLVFFFAAWAC